MIAMLIALQVVLPLCLIAWLTIAPLKSRLGLAVQVAAVALTLLVLWRAGIWMMPPWWAIFVYAALAVAAAVVGAKRVWHAAPVYPRGPAGWLGATVAVVLSVSLVGAFVRTIAAAYPPEGRVVDLAMPLPAGDYLVVSGGSNLSTNTHADALDQSVAAHRRWWGTGYGVDFIAIDVWGLRASGILPSQLDAYRIFDVPVLAPCGGTVVTAEDGHSDMTPPAYDRTSIAGNHVILACGDVHVLLGHFKRGSVTVRQGDAVGIGRTLGRVGNSGGSDEPHLHIHVQLPGTAGAPVSGQPLPATFNGRFLVRGERVRVP